MTTSTTPAQAGTHHWILHEAAVGAYPTIDAIHDVADSWVLVRRVDVVSVLLLPLPGQILVEVTAPTIVLDASVSWLYPAGARQLAALLVKAADLAEQSSPSICRPEPWTASHQR